MKSVIKASAVKGKRNWSRTLYYREPLLFLAIRERVNLVANYLVVTASKSARERKIELARARLVR